MNRKALLILMLLSFCFYGLGFGQQTLPYSYGFEDNNLATDGWTTQNPANSNSSEFGIYTGANRSGSYGFRFSSYSSASSYDQYLISPQLSVAGDAINITAQFYYKATNSSSETFKVGYSTTDTELTSFTWGNEVSTNNTNWVQSQEYEFPSSTKYVAIHYYSNYKYRLYVDDFEFKVIVPEPDNVPTHIVNTVTDSENEMTWSTFASNVNNGISTYNGKTVYLDEDISIVNEMVGTSDYPFRGTFNGQNHTLTVDITSTESYTAPFHFVNGAIIENLIVEGEVKSTSRHSSGLVGNLLSTKTITIQNCLINTNVGTSSTNTDYCGGIIGHSHDGDITIIGSAYTGTLTVNGNNLTGGLIGWGDTPTRVSVSNSIFAGNYNGNGYFHPVGCANHANSISSSAITISNCYFTVDATSNFSSGNTDKPIDQKASNKGKHAYSITGVSPVTVAMNGTPVQYNLSGIDAYTPGIVYNSTLYAGDGDNVSLNLDGSTDGYQTSYGNLTGSENPYTLAMATHNTEISVLTTPIGLPTKIVLNPTAGDEMTWEQFASYINEGDNYEGKTVKLMEDISVTTMVGSSSNHFLGTFDGQGHTITIDYTSTAVRCAVFNTADNATFMNLRIAGTMSVSHFPSGALVGYVHYGCHFINCVSDVEITATASNVGDRGLGGFLGEADRGSNPTIYFDGCAFTGKLIGDCNGWGGFVGRNRGYVSWSGSNSDVYFTNCLFAPAAIPSSTSGCATFARSDSYSSESNSHIHINNCYYTQVLGQAQGRQAYSITGDENITVDFYGEPTITYSMSGLSFYDAGFKYNNVVYAGSGDTVSLNLDGSDNGYTAVPGELTGDSNPYTITMGSNNTLIIGGTIDYITEINSSEDWITFCQAINDLGHDYSSETVTLMTDITISTAAAANDTPFRGTFNGNGNTITLDFGSTSNYLDQRCAPFYRIGNATIKDVAVDGNIYSSQQNNASLVCRVETGTNNYIINCISSVSIHSNRSGDGTNGGLVALLNANNCTVNFEGCAFVGELIGSNTSNWGGFVGWRDYQNGNYNYANFTNCFFGPTTVNISTSSSTNSRTFCRSRDNTTSGATYTNCYYTTTVQANDGGRQAYTITGDEGITVDFNGDPTTTYSTSGLSFYDAGFECNNVLYASSGDNVSLNLEGSDNGYTAIPGELTGDSNPYTLQMTAANTLITTHIEYITEINNVDDWNAFCLAVLSGHTYAGETVNLNADISVTTMAGQMGSGQNPFGGTFDGHGNTITVDYTSTGIRCSVFPTANRATFKNLIVDGHMSVSHFPAGGIIGYVHYECHIINCVSKVEITCTSSDSGNSGVGGILGEADRSSNPQIYFEGCAFTGKLIGNCNGWGGFVGRNRGYVNWSNSNSDIYFTNCMFAPTSLPESTSGCATFARSDTYSSENNSHIHITNCYYTQALGQVQGKQAYSITNFETNINPVTVELYGEHTYYDASDIDGYNVGIVYNGTIYAGNGENVSLALEGSPSGAYDATYGTITGTENPFTLAMVAHDTEISALTCPAPTGLEETEITAYNATLNWNGISDNYNVRFYEAIFFDSFEEDLSQWTIYHEGDESTWEWGIENPNVNSSDLSAHSGNFAVVAYGMDSVQADNWLISPQIEFPTQTTLKFWVMRSTYDEFKDEYEVLLSTTGNAIEDFTTILKESEVANSYWTEVVIDLSEYDGETGYIAIRHNHYHGFFIMVDDFGIYGWSELIPVNGNSYTLEGLQPDTYYQWQVQADCGEEDGVSFWSETSSFKTLETCPTPFNLTASEVTAYGATLNWTGYSESYEVMVGELQTTTINYDFEEDAIISDDFTNTSAYPWTIVSGGLNGSYCIKSGNAGQASTTSSISLTITTPNDGTIEFDAECMGEGTSSLWDHCDFYIDNTRKLYYGANISGWNHYSFAVTAGEHTFTWSYTKDGSVDPNGDYFAVDNIVIESTNIASWISYEVSEPPFVLVDAESIQTNTSYVVKVKGFCEDEETEYSDAVTFTTLSENTKIFVFEGEWSNDDNWVPVGVPTIDDDVILRAEVTVFDVAEANTITIDDAGTLTIEDGGQLKTNSDVTATMKKFIIGYGTDYVETDNGYYLMTLPTAAPVSAADAGLLTEESDYDLYSWDRTATDEEWQNNHDGIDLQNGVGFLYANRDDMEMSFTATLRNSSEPVVVTPSYDEVEHGGWNLCGNPFPCEAYITTDAEGMAFYRLVDNQLELIEGAIAPLEAFFVKATAAGQTFTISREAPEESKSPTNGNTNRFKVSTVTK